MSSPGIGGTVGRDHLWRIATCQFEDLKFADQKAIALLGISDLIAAVVAAAVGYFSGTGAPMPATIRVRIALVVIGIGLVFAAIATSCAINAIRPRGKLGRKRRFGISLKKLRLQDNSDVPLTHLLRIASYGNHGDYIAALCGVDGGDLDDELAKDIHRMAEIAFLKYGWIKWAVWCAWGEFLFFLAGITALTIARFF
jgi:hypothetical protein